MPIFIFLGLHANFSQQKTIIFYFLFIYNTFIATSQPGKLISYRQGDRAGWRPLVVCRGRKQVYIEPRQRGTALSGRVARKNKNRSEVERPRCAIMETSARDNQRPPPLPTLPLTPPPPAAPRRSSGETRRSATTS